MTEQQFHQHADQHQVQVQLDSFYEALIHKNYDIIDLLVHQGLPINSIVDNGRSALKIALELEDPKLIEFLLILSMRTNTHFIVDELNESLNFGLEQDYFNFIEIGIYALKQHHQLGSKIHLITVVDYMNSLIQISKSSPIPPAHLHRFESLMNEAQLNQHELKYMNFILDQHIDTKNQDLLFIYNMLADKFFYNSLESFNQKRKQYLSTMLVGAPFLFFISVFFLMMGIEVFQSYRDLSTSLPAISSDRFFLFGYFSVFTLMGSFLGLCATYFFTKSIFDYKSITKEIDDERLHYFARRGDYYNVQDLISKNCRVNCLRGLCESTPLYEATKMKHLKIIELLKQHQGFYGKKNKISYPD